MLRTQFGKRSSAAVCGFACLAGIAFILRSIESRSILVLTVVTVLALAAALLTGLALARESVWQSLADFIRSLLARQKTPVESRLAGFILVVIGLVGYVSQLGVQYSLNDSYAGEDEEAYLITAREIHVDQPSLYDFVQSLYAGEFTEANRHPLYLWLLSYGPSFEGGKFLSLIHGVWAMLLMVGVCIRRGSNWLHTGIVCLLLGWNSAWLRFSVTVSCESLLVLIVACLWFQLSVEPVPVDTDDANTKREPQHNGHFLTGIIGVLAALLWLAKGTGLLLTAGIAVWIAIRRLKCVSSGVRSGGAGQGCQVVVLELLVFAVAWVAVASPLLVRNHVRYGSPFYNVNSWLLFEDEYADPVTLSEASTIGAAAQVFLAEHSPSDILYREWTGLVWETYILIRSLGPVLSGDARVLPGAVIAVLAVLGWCVSRREEKWLLLIWLIVFLMIFAWYVPVAAGERFVLPLLLPIVLCAADGAVQLAGSQRRGR